MPEGERGLTEAERAAAEEGRRLVAALGTSTATARTWRAWAGSTPKRRYAPAYSCAYAGLRPADARAVVGPPDAWVELPQRDYWMFSTP